jgi:hypothetical protein
VLFVVPSLIQQLVGLVQALPDAAQMHKLVQQFDAWVKTLSPQAPRCCYARLLYATWQMRGAALVCYCRS